MARRVLVSLGLLLALAGVVLHPGWLSAGVLARVGLRFTVPCDAGGVSGKLCWTDVGAFPLRVEGEGLVGDPGALPPGTRVTAFDGPWRLGEGPAGPDGSVSVALSRVPVSRPVAVISTASQIPAGWVPYSWKALPKGPARRYKAGLAFVGGTVHLYGGSYNGPVPAGHVWCVYDPVTGSWSYLSSEGGPSQRYAHVMVSSSEGDIWLFAGRELVGSYPLVGDLWRWREGAGWQRVFFSGGPCARGWSDGVWQDGKLWVFGGLGDVGRLGDLWAWDPGVGAWQSKEPGPPARCMHAVAAAGGRIYVHGGSVQTVSGPAVKGDLWEYDPAAGVWQQKGSGPALYDHSMVGNGGLLYAYGGCDPAGKLSADVWVYDPGRDVWDRLAPSGTWPPARQAHAACAGEGQMFVFGALSSGADEFWHFKPGFAAPGQ